MVALLINNILIDKADTKNILLSTKIGVDAIGLLVGQRRHSTDFISAAVARDIARAKSVAR